MVSYYDAVKFFQKYSQLNKSVLTYANIYELLRKHAKYGTAIVKFNKKNEVVAIALWNIIDNGKTARVSECVIHPNYRSLKMIKELLRNGIKKSGNINKVTWERKVKYPNRNPITYKVKES